jgi:hypothetical protein
MKLNRSRFLAALLTTIALAVSASAQTATSTAGVQDKYATVFGAKIHYLEAGSGPVVILVHGLGGDASNWAPTIGPLA